MSHENFTKAVTYAAVFALGYYLGGGCDYNVIERDRKIERIERKVENYGKKIERLEEKAR